MAHVSTCVPSWWPPRVGDHLRLRDDAGPSDRPYLAHVVAVFRHRHGPRQAVIAYYGRRRRRWFYEVVGPRDAEFGRVGRA